MEATFAITVDPRLQLMHVVLRGFFSPIDVTTFAKERVRAHGMLKGPPNQHLTLVDIRQMKIQSQQTVGEFTAILSQPAFHARRLAFVVDKSLCRLQVRRAASSRSASFFVDYDDAHRWLLTGE